MTAAYQYGPTGMRERREVNTPTDTKITPFSAWSNKSMPTPYSR